MSVTSTADECVPALTASRQAQIAIRLGEDLEIQQIEHPLVVQGENSFQDYDMGRIDGIRLIQSSMLLKRVDRDVRLFAGGNRLIAGSKIRALLCIPRLDVTQSFDQRIKIDGFRGIEVVFISEGGC